MPRMDKPVFPLMALHRKELRELKVKNVGNLNSQLHTIKRIKKEEFINKYTKKVEKELIKREKDYTEKIKKVALLDTEIKEHLTRIKEIDDMIKEEEVYDEEKGKYVKKNKPYYDDFFSVETHHNFSDIIYNIDHMKKEDKNLYHSFNRATLKDKILSEMFSEQFEESFKKCEKLINSLETQYEEAINFGDLEQVKSIYFFLKDSEKFFEQVSNLKV